jgi:HD-GYP domain-containing protein (c-di-GMP phosphodiesterase class II)
MSTNSHPPHLSFSSDYLPVPSLDIDAERPVNFDIYLNLPINQKIILFRKKGSGIEADRLAKFQAANLSHFWIEKKDYQEFIKYVALRLRDLIGVEDTDIHRKLMRSTARSLLASTFHQSDPTIARVLMGNLHDISNMLIEQALQNEYGYDKKVFRRLQEIAESGSDSQRHPVHVAAISVLITFGIGYSNERILSDLAMAALLHDVGLSKLSPLLAKKAHAGRRFNQDERLEISKHPELALEILSERKMKISDLSKTLILQHHEEFNGSGYPKGLRGYNINELAQVMRVADDLEALLHEIPEVIDDSLDLRSRVKKYFSGLQTQKSVEPELLSRIRSVFF